MVFSPLFKINVEKEPLFVVGIADGFDYAIVSHFYRSGEVEMFKRIKDTVLHQIIQCFLYHLFAFGVQGAGCLP